jgi:pimeloyl-ACP methyl ester carboxylesterase
VLLALSAASGALGRTPLGGLLDRLSEEDIARYRMAFRQPGAATAATNYYRAMARRITAMHLQEGPLYITQPTLLLWGTKDPALDPANADALALQRWVPRLQVELLDTGHWAHMTLPEVVNEKLFSFLSEHQPVTPSTRDSL